MNYGHRTKSRHKKCEIFFSVCYMLCYMARFNIWTDRYINNCNVLDLARRQLLHERISKKTSLCVTSNKQGE